MYQTQYQVFYINILAPGHTAKSKLLTWLAASNPTIKHLESHHCHSCNLKKLNKLKTSSSRTHQRIVVSAKTPLEIWTDRWTENASSLGTDTLLQPATGRSAQGDWQFLEAELEPAWERKMLMAPAFGRTQSFVAFTSRAYSGSFYKNQIKISFWPNKMEK